MRLLLPNRVIALNCFKANHLAISLIFGGNLLQPRELSAHCSSQQSHRPLGSVDWSTEITLRRVRVSAAFVCSKSPAEAVNAAAAGFCIGFGSPS
jgi:hypothetical protein